MGNGDNRTGEGGKEAFKPSHRLCVKVVGGFVEQQNVGRFQQQAAQGHAAAFTTRNLRNGHVAGRAAQGVHGHFKARIQIPDVLGVHEFLHFGLTGDQRVHFVRFHGLGELGVDFFKFAGDGGELAHAVFNNLAHGAGFFLQRFLFKVADGVAGGQHGFAVKGLIHPCQNAQQAGFTRAVQTKHADFGPVKIGKRNVFQHFLLAMALGDADHGINNLVRFVAHDAPQNLVTLAALRHLRSRGQKRAPNGRAKLMTNLQSGRPQVCAAQKAAP